MVLHSHVQESICESLGVFKIAVSFQADPSHDLMRRPCIAIPIASVKAQVGMMEPRTVIHVGEETFQGEFIEFVLSWRGVVDTGDCAPSCLVP